MSGYGYEVYRAKHSARTIRTVPLRSRGVTKQKAASSEAQPSTLISQPNSQSFLCGDVRLLVAYHYIKRSPGRLNMKQKELWLEVESHVLAPTTYRAQPDVVCACQAILRLIDRYFDSWWRGEGIEPGLRAAVLDSRRISDDDIELIITSVEGWLERSSWGRR